MLSRENRKLRDDLITVLEYAEVYLRKADQFSIPTAGRTEENLFKVARESLLLHWKGFLDYKMSISIV